MSLTDCNHVVYQVLHCISTIIEVSNKAAINMPFEQQHFWGLVALRQRMFQSCLLLIGFLLCFAPAALSFGIQRDAYHPDCCRRQSIPRNVRTFASQGGKSGDKMATATTDQTLDLPTFDDVVEASNILEGIAHNTPVMTSRTLNDQLNCQAFFKCENFQRMGAFKFRGGYNALSHLTEEQRTCGVLTFSSGNHAQAIALSAQLLGCQATIIMPLDAPKLKVAATQGYGGNVVFYDRYKENRDDIARQIQQESGAVFVPPYDDKYVIAGQGTSAKELLESLVTDHNIQDGLDYLFVCLGGGGLISGCALAADALSPNCKVIGVEPEAGNDAQQSLAKGEIVTIATPPTIADGAQTQYIGKLTFEIIKSKVHSIITVTDQELIDDMKFFGERMKMTVEPTGCLSIAGLRKMVRQGEIPAGSRCGVIISGGNVDLTRYCELISSASS